MKKWRRPFDEDDDDGEGFSYLLDDDDDDDVGGDAGGSSKKRKRRRSYPAARPLRVTRFDGLDDDDDDEEEEGFEELEAKIRQGKYKPKKSDPWTAHILYQNLKALGEI